MMIVMELISLMIDNKKNAIILTVIKLSGHPELVKTVWVQKKQHVNTQFSSVFLG